VRGMNATLRRRLLLILAGFVAAFGLLIVRLAYIQVFQSPLLSQRAEDLWSRNIPVQPKRGTIMDRNGNTLALTASAPTVVAIPAQIRDKEDTAARLARVLGVSSDAIRKRITQRTLIVYIPGGRRISEEKARQIRGMHLSGIYMTEDGKREYPHGDLLAHVLGFTGSDNQGLTGVERWYDERLRGVPGRISFFANARGEEMPDEPDFYTPPVDGEDLVLTVDQEIDMFVRREIDQTVATYNPDSVTAIVADPKTGQILAMENYPTYDPSHYKDYPQEVYNRNLAIWKTFEPGSTFKIVTLSAALQEKKINLKDSFFDPGYREIAGRKIRCWKAGGHGSESFLEVVENSCNPGFMLMGERLGKETLFQYIRNFGFGSKTNIDIPGEGNGILFKLSRVGPLELATTSFGQGVSVTPIQQVMAISAIANGGLLMKPYVALEWKDHKTGEILQKNEPVVVRRVLSAETANQVRDALESVVARGTGANAYVDGYRVAGKTGTAQVASPQGGYRSGHYIVSFIGMAPANDPRLVVYIAVDNPKAGLIFGGVIAAPAVGRILADSLQYMGVPPVSGGVSREYRPYLDIVPEVVPPLAGRSKTEAQKTMMESAANLKVQTVGNGDYIIAQSPAPGTKLPPGSTIRLYLGDPPSP
jgi:stage V sporulation protein D (sporulation-specific penicillin-binding protein)